MRLLYTILLYLGTPLFLWRLHQKGKRNPDYKLRWSERFGHVPFTLDGCVWLHSVSLGESIAAAPIIKHLLATYPEKTLLVTTTTPTGSAHIQKLFGDKVKHCYFPYDVPHAVARFLRRTQPTACIIMETELWPNMLRACQAHKIPVLLANARLSERSAQGYGRFAGVTKNMLHAMQNVVAQYQDDGDRFVRLGLPKDRLNISGNIKFDITVPDTIEENIQTLRKQIGNRPVWIAASTHAGEEEAVFAAHHTIMQSHPEALCILVPRHPERFDEVATLATQQGLTIARRSSGEEISETTQLFLGDTMGEMMRFFALSHVAFIGGSLAPIGGHNLLEPAALSVPSLTGPNMHNFKEIAKLFTEAGATQYVHDAKELAQAVLGLFADPAQAKVIGQKGLAIIEENRGALQTLLQHIAHCVEGAQG